MTDDLEKHDDPAIDLDAWEPQAPPPQFAERVLARVRVEERAPARSSSTRRWGVVTAGVLTLAIAAAITLRIGGPADSGEAIAQERVEVSIGSRARAVLEPGALVSWNGDDVTQPRGDVFYRVQPGARFRVHTPAGDVEVKGTCFTVKVRAGEEAGKDGGVMQKRDVKVGAVGAALSALAFVAVYEGKVAVSHASGRVELGAGESAQLGSGGVQKLADGQKADAKASAEPEEDSLSAANGNLVVQVSEYKKRLEALAGQKVELEKKLDTTEKQLSAERGGGASPSEKHAFDLGPDEWKELAKEGTIKARTPCQRSPEWQPKPEALQKLGLAPQDGPIVKAAYTRSNERLWAAIKPICTNALGSAEAAEKVGPSTCQHLVLDIERRKDSEAVDEAMRFVGEVRAGLRPMPGPNEPLHPVARAFLAVTGETKAFESDLAQALGPEEAHRLTYADEMCMGQSTWGGGSKAPR